MSSIDQVLGEHFGLDEFRYPQREIIEAGLARPNLRFEVRQVGSDREKEKQGQVIFILQVFFCDGDVRLLRSTSRRGHPEVLFYLNSNMSTGASIGADSPIFGILQNRSAGLIESYCENSK